MSKRYNIIDRLRAANERPFISVTEDKNYEVNTSKTAALHIQAISMDEKLTEEEMLDKLIEVALGKKALKEITEMNLSLQAYMLITEAVMAAIGGEELEEVKERFQEPKESK